VHIYPYIGIAVVIVAALNGIGVLRTYFLLFTGTRHVSSVPLAISMRERIVVLTIATLIIGGGLFPQPGVASRHLAAQGLLRQRGGEPVEETDDWVRGLIEGMEAEGEMGVAEGK
jgi:NADH-quinone oxidoreductase subunit M